MGGYYVLDEAGREMRRRRGWSEQEIDELERRRRRNRELLREFYEEQEAELREMEEERRNSDPASARAMVDLRVPAVGETREQDCAVCLEELLDGGRKLRMMHCGHSFHQRCIFDWLYRNRRCPLCRFAITSVEQERVMDLAEAVAVAAAAGRRDGLEAAKRLRLGPGSAAFPPPVLLPPLNSSPFVSHNAEL